MAFKNRPIIPRTRRFYEGGFQPVMTRRESALILGVRMNQLISLLWGESPALKITNDTSNYYLVIGKLQGHFSVLRLIKLNYLYVRRWGNWY
ncbi:hypothetical protein MKW94_030438 [Papaver nudicaule]|uniref:Uncharacterized protein n=1 Tax=Papaver nudicaule TaxID=74823 RepID=A0AA42AYH6_PAPNU|nr:hypothetical protein [Papaver nudicaule]